MKKQFFFTTLLLNSLLSLSAAELKVSAAASLSDALKALAPAYEKTSGDKCVFNFGASGTLARQIKEGAPADLILSADQLRVDQLEKSGLLLEGTRHTLLVNTLVLVVASDSSLPLKTITDLPKLSIRSIAIGEPATVPIGTYTKEYLQKLSLWTSVSDRCVPLDTVRAVLAAVESGNAKVGFVYKTDALISKKVRIALEIPAAEGPKITYPVAVIKASANPESAKAFALFLQSEEASAVFKKFGFQIP